jgi:hypothetical protein
MDLNLFFRMAPSKKKAPFTEALIHEVQDHSSIWDKRSKDYKNIFIASNAWREIYENLKSAFPAEDLAAQKLDSVEGIKDHWKNLRDTYARTKKKTRGKSGAGNNI